MNKKNILVLFLLIFSIIGVGQNQLVDKQYFATPNVASFTVFEDIQVSHYTGSPNISIPVFNLKDGAINIPIELRYHGSGIKVEEEASWVGLGWNLNVGGSVTCRVNGKMDEIWYDTDTSFQAIEIAKNTGAFSPISSPSPLIPYRNESDWEPESSLAYYQNLYGQNEDRTGWTYEGIQYKGAAMLYGYYKPDIYSYSLPFGSGKFYYNHARGKAYSINESSVMEIDQPENYKWAITDDQGTVFYFNTPQRRESSYGDPRERDMPNTYFLDKIVYPNGQIALFEYDEKEIVSTRNSASGSSYTVLLDGDYDWSHCCLSQGFARNRDDFAGESYYPRYLKRIVTNNFIVEFKLSDESRVDVPGEYILEKIIVTSNYGTEKKEFSFNYNYFNNDNTIDDALYKRLKLVSFKDGKEGVFNFTYNESIELPSKNSYSRDYWGYYNQSSGENCFLPDLKKLYSNNHKPSWLKEVLTKPNPVPKRNRATNLLTLQAGMLKRIYYPTGGYSEFIFEPHTFSNFYYEKYDDSDLNVFVESEGTNTKTFFVDANYEIDVHCSIGITPLNDDERNDPSLLYNIMQGCYAEFYEDNILIKKFQISESYNLSEFITHNFSPEKEYKFITYKTQAAIEHGYSGVNLQIRYNKKDKWSYGGGLRIAEVKLFSKDNKIQKHKQYFYESKDLSFGKLMSNLKFVNKDITACLYDPGVGGQMGEWHKSNFDYVSIFSNSNIAISNSAGGSVVGYSKVVERTIGEEDNGSTIFYFHNEPSSFSSSIFPDIPDLQNGQLSKKEIIKDNIVLTKEYYKYQEIIAKSYYGFAGSTSSYKLPNGFMFSNFSTHAYNIPASVYKPVEIIKRSFFKNRFQEFDSVEVKTKLFYNTKNLLSYKTIDVSSSGKEVSKLYKYPLDYDLSLEHPVTELGNRNMISHVIEEQVFINGNLVTGNLTYYDFFGSTLLPSKNYSFESALLSDFGQSLQPTPPFTELIPNGVPYQLKSTLNYNANGNLLSYRKNGDVPVSYVWGYNNQFPIAKIIGLPYDSLSVGVLSEIGNLDDTNADLTIINSSIRNYLPSCQISTYTFDPLVGLTTKTDQNGKMTYFDYDSFGRLKTIKDHNKKVLANYNYFINKSLTLKINSINGSGTYNEGENITFNVETSLGNPDGLTYSWELKKEGSVVISSNEQTFNHTIIGWGDYVITCTVSEISTGTTDTKSLNFTVAPLIVAPNIVSGPLNLAGVGTAYYVVSEYGSAESLEYEVISSTESWVTDITWTSDVPNDPARLGVNYNIPANNSGYIKIRVRGIFGEQESEWSDYYTTNVSN